MIKFKKSFTLIELIISITVGSALVFSTVNVLTQSLGQTNDVLVAGTMDNYASSIQDKIRRELITARNLNISTIRNETNVIDSSIVGNQGYNYKNMYYATYNELNYGIIYNEEERRISVVFYPEMNWSLPADMQEFREMKVIFSEEGSNNVEISNLKWNIDNYNINAENYNNPDFAGSSYMVVKYQFTLTKRYSNAKEPLVKTYYFTEVLECSI